jgi:4-hydroxyproline epimerase
MRVIDSHTGGEPTRIIIEGGPDLGSGSMAERRLRFARDFDAVRRATLLEPRGFDAMVGGMLCTPVDPSCAAGIIFFNNAGMLGMCGHGTIGLAVTLRHLGLIGLGQHRIETPVGPVSFTLLSPDKASITNVPSYRLKKDVVVEVPDIGKVKGDVAWGGNWFFLTKDSPCAVEAENIPVLTRASEAIRKALNLAGITGTDGEIDHIEIFGKANPGADSRSFVLCPGGAYDRSPCGTGTSAKLACLAADGELQPGQVWVQESVIGSRFEASYQSLGNDRIQPTIIGEAYITMDARIIRDPADPFRDGISAPAAS